jgi:hypothetical protein
MTDAGGDFAIHPICVPIGMFGLNRSAQNDPRRSPHSSRYSQPLGWRFFAQNIGHLVVEHLKIARWRIHGESDE